MKIEDSDQLERLLMDVETSDKGHTLVGLHAGPVTLMFVKLAPCDCGARHAPDKPFESQCRHQEHQQRNRECHYCALTVFLLC